MLPEDRFFRVSGGDESWRRYCGFNDLTPFEFMTIQERLLMEQIELMHRSPLGMKLIGQQMPKTVDEFRKMLPFTTYADYAPYIGDAHEESLPEKPLYWVHTSSVQGSFKRVPWTSRFHEAQLRHILAALILSSATRRGEVHLRPGCRIMALLPERPFVSAHLAFGLRERFSAEAVLPLEMCERLPFRQKVDASLENALSTDVDYIISMASLFMPVEQSFGRMMQEPVLSELLPRLHPTVAQRLMNHLTTSPSNNGSSLTPKDLWRVKGIVMWGADSDTFGRRVSELWGCPLLQLYGSSEAGIAAMQDWDRAAMTFVPDSVFLEFIPMDDSGKVTNWQTVLIGALEEGRLYEPVITSFYGMPFLRYRQGDLLRVVSVDQGKEQQLPKVVFRSRADDLIDLFGIARIVPKTFQAALRLAGIPYGDWSVGKDFEEGKPVLKLFVELDEESHASSLQRRLHRSLMRVDRHYVEATFIMAYNPLRVVPLRRGSFAVWAQCEGYGRGAAQSSLAPRMNISKVEAEALVQRGAFDRQRASVV